MPNKAKDGTEAKVTLAVAIARLDRDGAWRTYNTAMALLSRRDLTEIQKERVSDSAKCPKCQRVYCDHERKGAMTDVDNALIRSIES